MKLDNVIAVRKTKKVYEDEGKAIKVFNEDYSTADVLNEALNSARVEETGLSVPKLLEVTKIDGKWAIVTEFKKGKTLQQLMDEKPADLKKFMEKFVNLQVSMHDKRAPLLNKLKDKMKRKISETGLDATIRYELNTRLESMPKHNKVLHGDFNPSNIIVGEDGVDYIIDWSHATQGNSGADAARTYLLFNLNGNQKAAEMYLDLFCKKVDMAKQYVQQWIPIVAASQLVKGNPEEREFLMNWINVVDYE